MIPEEYAMEIKGIHLCAGLNYINNK